jgi:hypothetical protein
MTLPPRFGPKQNARCAAFDVCLKMLVRDFSSSLLSAGKLLRLAPDGCEVGSRRHLVRQACMDFSKAAIEHGKKLKDKP